MKNMNNTIIKVGVLIQKNNKLLLIRERGWIDKKYRWNIVKGSFEPQNDADILEAARREAKEEAGASIRIKRLLNILYLKKPQAAFIQFNFVADLIGSHIAIASKEKQRSYRTNEDIIELRFFTKRELKQIKKEDLIGERTYQSIQAWLKKNNRPTTLFLTVKDY